MSVVMRQLDSTDRDFHQKLMAVLAFEASEDEAIDRIAASIITEVRLRGDAALLEYTNKFDRLAALSIQVLEIPRAERQAALAGLPEARRHALQQAADRVRAYHERQKKRMWLGWICFHRSRWHGARAKSHCTR